MLQANPRKSFYMLHFIQSFLVANTHNTNCIMKFHRYFRKNNYIFKPTILYLKIIEKIQSHFHLLLIYLKTELKPSVSFQKQPNLLFYHRKIKLDSLLSALALTLFKKSK